MDPRTQRLLSAIVAESCHQLFADYGLPLERRMADVQTVGEISFCGVIGFTGTRCRGVLLLAVTEAPLLQSNPTSAPARHWIAELANQLLGRVKNRLLRHDVDICASTPIVLRGQHLAPLPRRNFLPVLFSSGTGYVGTWLDCELIGIDSLPLDEYDVDTGLIEGDAVLF
jgi:hypothetical protein